jgi:hypothetical protein
MALQAQTTPEHEHIVVSDNDGGTEPNDEPTPTPALTLSLSQRKAVNRAKYRNRKKKKKKEENALLKRNDTVESPVTNNDDEKQLSNYTNTWNQMYAVVEQFRSTYGRLPSIRGTQKAEATVGRWIYLQKHDRKKGGLPIAFIEKLEKLGI